MRSTARKKTVATASNKSSAKKERPNTMRFVLLALLACTPAPEATAPTPTTPPPQTDSVDAAAAVDVATVDVAVVDVAVAVAEPRSGASRRERVDAAATKCASTLARAEGASCRIGDAPCTYADGSCNCADFPQCGGAQRPPANVGMPGIYACQPKDRKTAVRADGCPWDPPAAGAPCAKKMSCTWGVCSWSTTQGTCDLATGAKWQITAHHSPPPP